MASIDIRVCFNTTGNDAGDPTTPVIDIYKQDGTQVVTAGAMDKVGTATGWYEYTYTDASPTDGVYYWFARATISSTATGKSGVFSYQSSLCQQFMSGVIAKKGDTIRLPVTVVDITQARIAASTLTMDIVGASETYDTTAADIIANTTANTGEYYGTWNTTGKTDGQYTAHFNINDGTDTPHEQLQIMTATLTAPTSPCRADRSVWY